MRRRSPASACPLRGAIRRHSALDTRSPAPRRQRTRAADAVARTRLGLGSEPALVVQADTELSIKASPLVQEDLIDRDPKTFARAAYVGRFGWVEVNLERVPVDELESLLREAWRMTAPKKLAAAHPA